MLEPEQGSDLRSPGAPVLHLFLQYMPHASFP